MKLKRSMMYNPWMNTIRSFSAVSSGVCPKMTAETEDSYWLTACSPTSCAISHFLTRKSGSYLNKPKKWPKKAKRKKKNLRKRTPVTKKVVPWKKISTPKAWSFSNRFLMVSSSVFQPLIFSETSILICSSMMPATGPHSKFDPLCVSMSNEMDVLRTTLRMMRNWRKSSMLTTTLWTRVSNKPKRKKRPRKRSLKNKNNKK